ncbi:MAG: helix-turn-helix domain-containing protein [Micavibrio sp.]|nr:helix-turn-helix domain-containing protein [Micavibrio sp.]|tara:strand:- start:436 stop:954 length:519 start_codon:yes stop_codon:yes gene_type:complete
MTKNRQTRPYKVKKNINAKGRQAYSSEQFVKLKYGMIKHPNFMALKGASIKVLLYLCTKHTGFNNGKITASYDEIAKDLKMGKATALRACEELQYFGFLKLKKKGTFLGRKASDWELTFVHSEGYEPTHDWKEAKTQKRKRARKPFVEDISDTEEFKEDHQRKIEERYLNGP